MAITTTFPIRLIEAAMNEEVDLKGAGRDVVKIAAFVSAGFSADPDAVTYLAQVSGTELAGGTYARQTIGNAVVSYDAATNRVFIDGDDVTFSNLETNTTGIPRYFVAYDDANTDKTVVAIIDLGDVTTGVRHAADLVLQFNASGIVGVS